MMNSRSHDRSSFLAEAERRELLSALDEELDLRAEDEECLERESEQFGAEGPVGPPPSLGELRQRAVREAWRQIVEEVSERLTLSLRRRPALALVGGAGEADRAAVIAQVLARLRDGGQQVRHVHAGVDPFAVLDRPQERSLVIEAGLLAPTLAPLWLVPEAPAVLLSATLAEWRVPNDETVAIRTFFLPASPGDATSVPREPERGDRTARLFADAVLAAGCALAEWGVPVPVALLARAVGVSEGEAEDRLATSGLFVPLEGVRIRAYALGSEALLGRLCQDREWIGRRPQLLHALVEAADRETGGTIVALLGALALRNGRHLLRALRGVLARRVEQLLGPSVPHLIGWARALGRAGAPDLALAVLAGAERLSAKAGDEERADLERERARAFHQRRMNSEAREILERLGRRSPQDVQTLHLLARLERAEGSAERAIAVLDEALAVSPENPVLLVERARLAAMAGAADTSDAVFARALDAAPGAAGVLAAWSAALAAAGRRPEAAVRLERALGIEPWNVRYHLEQAQLWREAGQLAAAAVSIETALRLQPDDPEAFVLKAAPLTRGKWLATAERLLAYLGQAGWERGAGSWFGSRGVPGALRAQLERAGQVVPVALERATSALGADLPGAAAAVASSVRPAVPWVLWGDESTSIALTETEDGALVVTVEEHERPVEGAIVSLWERDEGGVDAERAVAVTDDRGEADLGPADALRIFLTPAARGRCRVKLVLPPGSDREA